MVSWGPKFTRQTNSNSNLAIMHFTKKHSSINFMNCSNTIPQIQHHLSLHKTSCKLIAIALLLFLFSTLPFSHQIGSILTLPWPQISPNSNKNLFTDCETDQTNNTNSTDLGHIVFGVVGSMNTWREKRAYVESWWRPNVTRGYVFLDRAPSEEELPWPSTSPPFGVNEDLTKLEIYPELANPLQVRLVRSILETFRQGDTDVRWYVMADDDTLLFIDNLVEVLAKYDHTKYYYIGTNSECFHSNVEFSFDMAFGGAGIALSYPVAEAVSRMLDGCIERYPHLWISDLILQTCLADIGVARTVNRGFHQIDLHGDISGLLSAHPQTPALSLHHLDGIHPIFPFRMNQSASINRLMTAAKADSSRLFQQAICFDRRRNWTLSVAWGYSIQIYESIQPRSHLRKPLETFLPWVDKFSLPFYMFNIRRVTDDPCEAPHAFFLDSVEVDHNGNQVVTTFLRGAPRNLPACRNHYSADHISTIRVVSSATTRKEAGVVECCDVEDKNGSIKVPQVKLRACKIDEILR